MVKATFADPDRIELAITERLSVVALKLYGRGIDTRDWTRAINEALRDLGKSEGLSTAICGTDGCDWGEWLFDICWYSVQLDGYSLKRLHLAMEMEWSYSRDARQVDFEKLVVAKADHRCFVFQVDSTAAIDREMLGLRSVIASFEGSRRGDRYLLVAFDNEAHQVDSHAIVVS